MSHEHVKCKKSKDWFKDSETIKRRRFFANFLFWKHKVLEDAISKLKREELTYSQRNSIIKHEKIIIDYEKHCSTEKYMV